ncbi:MULTISPECIES: tyrosine-type recombinase/integrase [unclassified Streptomyces]|uniref:tyrosine-type recombinase/integrase n=1 Tax=unclassified Streptomyces TaxID=2593676 RepID=UPI0022563AEA|nr:MULTISPECIES: tyrosine-type recombinase/integrase [unclassified Streptomyces]WSU26842.1 tyrosine-type recombinase/integrase [Streptomyces sp. NBC_01108]MCX4792380.1 tyrosine-type recombinase/integrase [Streptomyces sp. NBC_01221]MCX4799743.1 tyrosine-type recombinase/integrase [Streptomyces sp. NBC_01242]WSJ41485.1 tyrosine-type recombinase/integrase [Streptomyces sp. NBC_01321]WSP67698.1 tyrosine-type recombinase/integrase [Streptomyces sp. NBC_01240]
MSNLPAIPDADEIVTAELIDTGPALPAVVEDINHRLTPAAERALADSGRANTRETYEARFKAFSNWCLKEGRTPGPPTTAANLTSYVTELVERDIDPGTIRLTVAAIRHMNARAGFEQHPDQAPALKVYQDHRHAWQASGRGQRSSAPVDLERLRQMLDACPAETSDGRRDRVLLLLGYYMRARASELSRLRIGDLDFVSSDLLVAVKRISKNDKSDAGREYEIDDPACLAAVRTWLDDLNGHGQGGRHLPLLRGIDQWGNLQPPSPKGWGLSRQSVNAIVKRVAREASLDVADDVTAHGLRAGVPTDLGAQGYSAGEIKEITGDWSGTDMVEKYRKIGRRRAGKRSDDGRRADALSMLRVDSTHEGDQ